MAIVARLRSMTGRGSPINTIAASSTITLTDDSDIWIVTGTATVTSLLTAGGIFPGRTVRLISNDATGATFTNTNDPTTDGQMDLGGSDITLAKNDVLTLVRLDSGAWLRVSYTNN